MKTRIILILSTLFCIVNYGFTSSLSSDLSKNIQKNFVYPENAIKQNLQGDVWVAFKVDDEGKIEVFQANSSDNYLKEEVVRAIENMKPEQLGIYKNELYYCKISLRLI